MYSRFLDFYLVSGFMGIQESRSLLHWNYFLALEEDIERLARYVEFTEQNFNTYSMEITHMYLAACSEVDVVAKLLAKKIQPSSNPNRIDDYRNIINPVIDSLKNEEVSIPRYGLTLTPWSNWCDEDSPTWWRLHNKVKHERQDNYIHANIKNVLNAMSGLFLLILHLYKEHGYQRIEPIPSLFVPPESLAQVAGSWGGGLAVFYTEE